MKIQSLKTISGALTLAVITLLSGCEKYLDITPRDQFVPSALADLQLLLNNSYQMNQGPGLQHYAADEIALSDAQFLNENLLTSNTYTWEKEMFPPDERPEDWTSIYKSIYTTNAILLALEKNTENLPELRRKVEGEARFFRGLAYYNLISHFAVQYEPASAGTSAGVPLRLGTDAFAPEPRASVAAVYEQIFKDLNAAEALLPPSSTNKTRPGKAALYGLLARIYLQTGDYTKATANADKCLDLTHELVDYNTVPVPPLTDNRFQLPTSDNPELIFLVHSPMAGSGNGLMVGSTFYDQYDTHDLRRSLYFRFNNAQGNYDFIGSLNDGGRSFIAYPFAGIAVDEIYLIRAECLARAGDKDNALNDLNTLLSARFETGEFTDINTATADQALQIILQERKKELVFRGLRWNDLKRLNQKGANITITRTIAGTTYTLLPGSRNYVFPIPPVEVRNGGVEQNPRD